MTLSWADRWRASWELLGKAAPGDGAMSVLLAKYRESGRYYHTLQHLGECLELADEAVQSAERPGEVAIALWYHDAIYDTHRSDNEAESGRWAERVVLEAGGSPEVAGRISRLILATRHAAPPDPGDASLVVDIDLAILGAPEERFEEYEIQIHHEYDWVPDLVFRPARARILQGFLERHRIYSTAQFAARFEARARSNLLRALARLTA